MSGKLGMLGGMSGVRLLFAVAIAFTVAVEQRAARLRARQSHSARAARRDDEKSAGNLEQSGQR